MPVSWFVRHVRGIDPATCRAAKPCGTCADIECAEHRRLSNGEWKRELSPRGTELMPTGRVKFFNPDRGYGFITPDGGESDVFVHISAVEVAGMDTLVAGQFLAYDIGTARDGRSKAIDELKDATARALDILKAACPTALPSPPTG